MSTHPPSGESAPRQRPPRRTSEFGRPHSSVTTIREIATRSAQSVPKVNVTPRGRRWRDVWLSSAMLSPLIFTLLTFVSIVGSLLLGYGSWMRPIITNLAVLGIGGLILLIVVDFVQLRFMGLKPVVSLFGLITRSLIVFMLAFVVAVWSGYGIRAASLWHAKWACEPLINELGQYYQKHGNYPKEVTELASYSAVASHFANIYTGRAQGEVPRWSPHRAVHSDIGVMVLEDRFVIVRPLEEQPPEPANDYYVARYSSEVGQWEQERWLRLR